MKIAIASDHGGFELKEQLKQHYAGLNLTDLGTYSPESVDYPDIADKMAQEILNKKAELGILSAEPESVFLLPPTATKESALPCFTTRKQLVWLSSTTMPM